MTYKFVGYILIVLFLSLFSAPLVDAFSRTINISVMASICGNGIIEGNEDCEGADLGSHTCLTEGYASGTILCDVACSLDSGLCIPLPTPTPVITSPLTPSPVASFTPAMVLTSVPAPVAVVGRGHSVASTIFPFTPTPAAFGKLQNKPFPLPFTPTPIQHSSYPADSPAADTLIPAIPPPLKKTVMISTTAVVMSMFAAVSKRYLIMVIGFILRLFGFRR